MRALFLIVIVCAQSVVHPQTCPNICICDQFDGMNRANCSSHKLINAQIGMPDLVEVLDLSDNSIAVLDETSFSTLRHLRVLLAASNYIHTIELDTFGNLRQLQNLSLANNRLEWFDARIVENCGALQSVDLSGNKLMHLDTAFPLLSSASLLELRLRRALIVFVSAMMLSELPNLQRLDLSENLLITLHTAAFVQMRRLQVLDVVNNPFNCDANLRSMLGSLTRRKVKVINYDCAPAPQQPRNHTQMFERMVMQTQDPFRNVSTIITTTAKAIITEADLKSVWHPINATAPSSRDCEPSDGSCKLYRSCQAELAEVRGQQVYHSFPSGASRFVSIKPALYAGILIGVVLGGCVVYVLMIVREGCARRRKRQNRLRRTYVIRERSYEYEPELDSPMLHNAPDALQDPPPSAADVADHPVGTRRRAARPRRSAPAPQRLGRRKTMYNWLFDRPAHRRYVRSISQNTSNLVRRLSQSRLFLNFNPATSAAPQSQLDGIDAAGMQRESAPSLENDLNVVTVQYSRAAPAGAAEPSWSVPAATTARTTDARPETPPPMYGDIVK